MGGFERVVADAGPLGAVIGQGNSKKTRVRWGFQGGGGGGVRLRPSVLMNVHQWRHGRQGYSEEAELGWGLDVCGLGGIRV